MPAIHSAPANYWKQYLPCGDDYSSREARSIIIPANSIQFEQIGFSSPDRIGAEGPCDVWQGQYRESGSAFLKRFPSARSWHQEKRALEQWLPGLTIPGGTVPEILHADEKSRILILSQVAGISVEELTTDPSVMDAVMIQAGSFLLTLHQLSVEDTDSLPLNEAIVMRLESWIQAGDDDLSEDEIACARQRVGDGSLFRDQPRVPCHNDFQPRNWLWDGDRIGIIDFEHAHANHPAFDWIRMETGIWKQQPRLRQRFIEGYRGEPPWAVDEVISAIGAVHAVGCIVWGNRNGDVSFTALGRSILTD